MSWQLLHLYTRLCNRTADLRGISDLIVVLESCLAAPKYFGLLNKLFYPKFICFAVYIRILSITVLEKHTSSIYRVENGGCIQSC